MLPKIEKDTYVTLKFKYWSSIKNNNKEGQEFFRFLSKLHFNNFFINQLPSYKDIPWNNKNENSTSQ